MALLHWPPCWLLDGLDEWTQNNAPRSGIGGLRIIEIGVVGKLLLACDNDDDGLSPSLSTMLLFPKCYDPRRRDGGGGGRRRQQR